MNLYIVGDENATKILLDAGADGNIRSKYGATPLQYATLYGNVLKRCIFPTFYQKFSAKMLKMFRKKIKTV